MLSFHLIVSMIAAATRLQAAAISIDNTQKFQVMRGFGAASAWNSSASLNAQAAALWADDSAAAVASTASHINGHIGLSMLRTRIDPTGSFAGEAGPMTLAKGQNPNILIWSTEWSPPPAYKNNNNVNGPGATNTFNNTAANSTAYANYLVNYVKAIQSSYGVSLYAVSPQNEPDWNTSYESCIWTGAQFLDFVKNYMGPAFKTAGLATKIMIPDSFRDDLTLAAPTMNDAVAAPMVGIIAGHLYGGGPFSLASGNFTHLTTQENWETEMSDVSGANNDPGMTSGLVIAGWIHNCVVNAGMNAYHHWWIRDVNGDNSALMDNNGVVTKKMYVMGNYSKFIRPGFQRIGATAAPAAGINCSAYSTASRVVIVATNGNGSAASWTFNLTGISTGSVVPWVTDASNNLVQMPAVTVSGNSFSYTLPAQSLVTFVCDLSGSAPTATPTASGSPTLTRTPTSTATRTLSPTPSFSSTQTQSPSATPSSTVTKTPVPPTATSTLTRTSSPTPTFSGTPTRSASLSSTPSSTPVPPTETLSDTRSPSPTLTFSPTLTQTPSFTLTRSPSLSPSATGTLSFTRTASRTVTLSPTVTQQLPTATSSTTPPLASPTGTPAAASSTPTQTALPASQTPTPLPFTPTSSQTALPASPTQTLTALPPTATSTPTQLPPSATATPTAVPPTATSTLTAIPPSATGTLTPLPPSATGTSTALPPSATRTATAQGPTPSATRTETALAATATPTLTASPVIAPSHQPTQVGNGPLVILQLLPMPNPNPYKVMLNLAGPADSVTLRIWSLGFRLLAQSESGPAPKGWSGVALPQDFLRDASSGAYYMNVVVRRDGRMAASKPLKFMILR